MSSSREGTAAPTGTPRAGLPGLVVNGGGLAQGIVLVAFPATESVFRAHSGFALSANQYGQLFLPQVVLAIVTSLAGGAAARRFGLKRVLVAGLLADLVSMALLAVSAVLTGPAHGTSGYPVLLVATGFLGIGYGFTVPTLNSFAADLHPRSAARAVLTLNALLGLGTALAPVFAAIFVGVGAWWGLPILCGGLVLATLAAVRALQAPAPPPSTESVGDVLRHGRLWLFLGVALAYGIVETMAGTWSEPLARTTWGLSSTIASVVLAVFWAAVTVGRVIFSAVEQRIGPAVIYRVLPLVVAAAFGLIPLVSDNSAVLAVIVFAVVGLGASALLPLTVSYAQAAFPSVAAVMSALIIAAYEVGYGVAAFGVGPLHSGGIGLAQAFALAGLVAVALAFGAWPVSRRHRS